MSDGVCFSYPCATEFARPAVERKPDDGLAPPASRKLLCACLFSFLTRIVCVIPALPIYGSGAGAL